jgi:cobalamin biosynthesis protein CobW
VKRKVPATVITGFLGAGKTSLIRHLLDNANGKRIALVINEFGDLGVDRDILMGCGIPGCTEDDVIELANGCICCTVADDFLPTIERLLRQDPMPDHIVIETSGLALPKPLVKAFGWPEIRNRVTVDGVVAVIDGRAAADGLFATDPEAVQAAREQDESLDHESPLEELFEEQIQCADIVVLNKMDLLDDDGLAAATETVNRHLRPTVKTVRCSNGKLDPAILLGLGAEAENDLDSRPSHIDGAEDHDHDDFESFVVELDTVTDPEAVEARIKDVVAAHPVLRIKGFLHVTGKPMRQAVQGVGDRIQRYFDRPWQAGETPASRLVVIGSQGLDRARIAAALGGVTL